MKIENYKNKSSKTSHLIHATGASLKIMLKKIMHENRWTWMFSGTIHLDYIHSLDA